MWVDGFLHTGWLEMSEYYIQYFKTGYAPETEKVYFWLRPHTRGIDTVDWVGKPDGRDRAQNSLWAVVFCRTSGNGCFATLAVGVTSMFFANLQLGPNKLELPLDNSSFGTVRAQ
ncbi:hypothetical protein L218DRAFT_955425 [Marasmius fiardii PR-910]|nr:hypothetical protein L218DRAFT_955425 [Marasmius fiardii PR-910]